MIMYQLSSSSYHFIIITFVVFSYGSAEPKARYRRIKRQFPPFTSIGQILSNNFIESNTPAPVGPPDRCLNGAPPLCSCRTGNSITPCPPGTQCTLGYVCCPTLSNQIPGMDGPIMCADGQPAVGPCLGGSYCGMGFTCVNNRCCKTGPFNPPINFQPPLNFGYCPQGYQAVGRCINGLCPNGGFNQGSCVEDTCCRYSPLPPYESCPPGVPTLASCYNGQCPMGYTCTTGNICCASNYAIPISQSSFCPGGLSSAGQCINGQCQSGFVCTGGICCPGIDAFPAVTGNGFCPAGQQTLGQCISGLCPFGYTCISDQCCGNGIM